MISAGREHLRFLSPQLASKKESKGRGGAALRETCEKQPCLTPCLSSSSPHLQLAWAGAVSDSPPPAHGTPTHPPAAAGRSARHFNTFFLKGSWTSPTSHQKLIQDEVGLLKVEDDVQLVHDAEIFVQELHVSAGQLQRDEPVVLALDVSAEVEAGLFLIADLEVPPLQQSYTSWTCKTEERA